MTHASSLSIERLCPRSLRQCAEKLLIALWRMTQPIKFGAEFALSKVNDRTLANKDVAMTEFSRRDVLMAAASLAAGSGMATSRGAAGQESEQPTDAELARQLVDEALASANSNPQAYMLIGPETFQIVGDGHSRDLIITSALDRTGKPTSVHIPSGAMRIFRANMEVDEFTRQGGLHWRFHNTEGKVTLKSPGEIVMIVREGYDTVRCFIMKPDFRC